MELAPLFAHETWFTPGYPHDGYNWSFAWTTLPLALVVASLVLTVVVRVIGRWWSGIDVPFLGRMAPFMPFAIRMHLAVSLIGLLSLGHYLSPAMELEKNAIGVILGAVMAVVAIGMATGWHARWSAWLLIIAGPLGMLEFGFGAVLQRLDLLALAVCILVWGPGRWSADHELGHEREPSLRQCAQAIWILRMGVGGVLIIVAYAEKLANPDLARHFLNEHPYFNVFELLGFSMSDTTFLTIAGGVEVLFGLLIMSGALPQIGVLIVGVPFNATLWFFGTTELVGHLPVYGAMLVLLVYGSDPKLRPAVAALWPWRRERDPQLDAA